MLPLAWAESPGLAIQLVTRFPSIKLKQEIRSLLLNFPDKSLDEPDGLEIMFGPALPPDVSFQLKVCSLRFTYLVMTNRRVVSALLGSCQPNRSSYVLLAGIWQSPIHLAVCNESFGEPSNRRSLLFRSAVDSSIKI